MIEKKVKCQLAANIMLPKDNDNGHCKNDIKEKVMTFNNRKVKGVQWPAMMIRSQERKKMREKETEQNCDNGL